MEERQPAPGDLGLIEDFVNTRHEGEDHIATPDALVAWLAGHELAPAATSAGLPDVQRAAEVREALRRLLIANNGGAADPAAVASLNAFTTRVPFHLTFTSAAAAHLTTEASGVDAALARILRIVHRAMGDGEWERLKACRSDACQWAFYDSSRNHSAAWCSMRSCGNRHKARAYRSRMREVATDAR